MKRILCYGDSNTWGYEGITAERFSEEVRWPCVMQKMLGENYHVYENGMNSRTTAFGDDLKPYRNGVDEIIPALMITEPLDVIVFMLGTNDTKSYLGRSGFIIARGMEMLVQKAQGYFLSQNKKIPQILILAPIDIAEDIEEKEFGMEFDGASVQKIFELRKWYRVVARDNHCEYMDAGTVSFPGEDGIHMSPEGHEALAKAVACRVKDMIEE